MVASFNATRRRSPPNCSLGLYSGQASLEVRPEAPFRAQLRRCGVVRRAPVDMSGGLWAKFPEVYPVWGTEHNLSPCRLYSHAWYPLRAQVKIGSKTGDVAKSNAFDSRKAAEKVMHSLAVISKSSWLGHCVRNAREVVMVPAVPVFTPGACLSLTLPSDYQDAILWGCRKLDLAGLLDTKGKNSQFNVPTHDSNKQGANVKGGGAPKENGRRKDSRECFNCGQVGHLSADCPKERSKGGRADRSVSRSATGNSRNEKSRNEKAQKPKGEAKKNPTNNIAQDPPSNRAKKREKEVQKAAATAAAYAKVRQVASSLPEDRTEPRVAWNVQTNIPTTTRHVIPP